MYFKKPSNVNESFHFGKYPDYELSETTSWLGNQLLLYTLYHFLPLSNGSTQYFSTEFMTKRDSSGIPAGMVEDFSVPELLNGPDQTIYHKLPYFVSNPSLRKVSTPTEMCKNPDMIYKIGFRNFQKYVELGLPIQAKCTACQPIVQGLPTFFYLYPERDFNIEMHKLPISSRKISLDPDYCTKTDCEKSPRIAPLQAWIMNKSMKLAKENYTIATQYIGRWSNEQTTNNNYRFLQGEQDGEMFISRPDKLGFQEGITLQCAMELETGNNMIASNVFVNIDFLKALPTKAEDRSGFHNNPFRYMDYDVNKNGQFKYPVVQSIKDNLEIFINWEEWSCCSACCCPSSLCGYERQTATDCENVYSSKSRRGLLSIRKIDLNKKSGFDEYLNIAPYSTRGIPAWSTVYHGERHEGVAASMLSKFYIKNGLRRGMNSGVILESKSCKDDKQKFNCVEWAKCQGIELDGVVDSDLENEIDTCQTLDFSDILIGNQDVQIPAILNENFRIRIDPEIYDMDKTAIEWRINLREPKKFRPDVNCQIQGIVMRRNEILVIGIKNFKTKIDMITNRKTKIRISFRDRNHRTSVENIYWTVFYWSIAILIFFIGLIRFVVYIQKEKMERVKKTLKMRQAAVKSTENSKT